MNHSIIEFVYKLHNLNIIALQSNPNTPINLSSEKKTRIVEAIWFQAVNW